MKTINLSTLRTELVQHIAFLRVDCYDRLFVQSNLVLVWKQDSSVLVRVLLGNLELNEILTQKDDMNRPITCCCFTTRTKIEKERQKETSGKESGYGGRSVT